MCFILLRVARHVRWIGRLEDDIVMHLRKTGLDGVKLMWPALDVRLLGVCDCGVEIYGFVL